MIYLTYTRARDQLILLNVHRLCRLLYPQKINPLNVAVLRSQRIHALGEVIDELKHPKKFISVFHPFPPPPNEDHQERARLLRLKPRLVPRPTAKEQERLNIIIALLSMFRFKERQTASMN